ncbi:MAG: hypothetical protein GXP31_07220 [Kiritimatiellaeota bacterium]|nr:hypothetical protein [Kiritimatiellota bacterium]
MPNHIHALIQINRRVGNGLDRSANATEADLVAGRRVEPRPYTVHSLSTLVGAFKTAPSEAIHLAGHNQFRWQNSFHGSVVRNGRSLARITQYIHDNPMQWATDSENPESNMSMHMTGASRPDPRARVRPLLCGSRPQPIRGHGEDKDATLFKEKMGLLRRSRHLGLFHHGLQRTTAIRKGTSGVAPGRGTPGSVTSGKTGTGHPTLQASPSKALRANAPRSGR